MIYFIFRYSLILLLSLFYVDCIRAENGNGGGCAIVVPSSINFGAYDTFSYADTLGVGSFAVKACNDNKRSYVITLSTGISNTYTSRSMISGGDSLSYNLYVDPTYSAIWGSGSGGTSSVSKSNPTGETGDTIYIYGKIPGRQAVSSGIYSDNITITITF